MKFTKIWLQALIWSNSLVALCTAQAFDIRLMSPGLNALKSNYAGIGDFDIIKDRLPFFDQSLNELYMKDPNKRIDQLLDLIPFIANAASRRGSYALTPADIRAELLNYILGPNDQIVLAGGGCVVNDPLAVVLSESDLYVIFCGRVRYQRSMVLDGKGLFDTVDQPFEITLAAASTFTVDFLMKATLVIKADATYSLSDTFFQLSLNINLRPTLTFTLGMLDLTANANVYINGEFVFVVCSYGFVQGIDLCLAAYPSPYYSRLSPSKDFYYHRALSYQVNGALTLATNVPGLNIGNTAHVNIVEDDLFDPDPVVTITGFDYTDFLAFSPENCVSFLLLLDSALVRAQEQDLMQKNKLPFTEKTYANLLSTGSVITSHLLEFFVKAEPFKERAAKSLRITFPDVAQNKNGRNLGNVQLELYYLIGELTANPDNFAALRNGTQVCTLSFSRNVTTNWMLQADLIDAINRANCGITAWGGCQQDADGNFYGCVNAQLVVIIEDGQVVMATEAWTDNAKRNIQDFQLLGLFSKKPVCGEAILGFTLNEPAYPQLIPRFRNLEEVEDLINQAIDKEMDGVHVDLTYVPPDGVEISRFEVGIQFSRSVQYGTSFDGSLQIGDLMGLRVKDSDLNVTATITFNTTFGILLEPDPEEQITVLAKACDGKGYQCTIGEFSLQFEYTKDAITNKIIVTIPASSGLVNASTHLENAISDIASVYEKTNSLLAIKFNSEITNVRISPRRICQDPQTNQQVFGETEYECPKNTKVLVIPNIYRIGDVKSSKNGYRVAVGEIGVRANVTVIGDAQVSCTVLQVIDVAADIVADLRVTLTLTLGIGELIPFTDWLVALLAITSPKGEGHIPNFLKAEAVLVGTFGAVVRALPPFDVAGQVDASGTVTHTLDFLDIGASGSPNVTMKVDLPNIGDISKLSFRDIVDILVIAMELLVGGSSEDTVDSCTGGLLGITILEAPVFTYPIPGESKFSVCIFMGAVSSMNVL